MMYIYPELRAHAEELETVMETFALRMSEQPPAHLRSKVLTAIKGVVQEEGTADASKVVSMVDRRLDKASGSSGGMRWLAAAGVAAAVVLGGMWFSSQQTAGDLQQQVAELETELESNTEQQETLRAEAEALRSESEERAAINALLAQTTTQRVNLEPAAPEISAAVQVFWNPGSQDVLLQVENLPTVPEGKQYQLWAIVDGTPQDMGVFDLEIARDSVVRMPYQVATAQAFAITLENAGGSPTPNLDALTVIGNT